MWLQTLSQEPEKKSGGPGARKQPRRSKKDTRRLQYARLQALYKRDRAKAAPSVMDGSLENPITDRTVFLDAWQQLLETVAETIDLSTISGQ